MKKFFLFVVIILISQIFNFCTNPVSEDWQKITGDWMITDNDESYKVSISATETSCYMLENFTGHWYKGEFYGKGEETLDGIYTQSDLHLKIINDMVINGHVHSFNQYKGKSWTVEYDFIGNRIK